MIQQCSVLIKKRLLTIGISGSKLLSIYVFVFPWESFVPERCFEYVFFFLYSMCYFCCSFKSRHTCHLWMEHWWTKRTTTIHGNGALTWKNLNHTFSKGKMGWIDRVDIKTLKQLSDLIYNPWRKSFTCYASKAPFTPKLDCYLQVLSSLSLSSMANKDA